MLDCVSTHMHMCLGTTFEIRIHIVSLRCLSWFPKKLKETKSLTLFTVIATLSFHYFLHLQQLDIHIALTRECMCMYSIVLNVWSCLG